MLCKSLVQVQSRTLSMELRMGPIVLGGTDRGAIKVWYLNKSLAFLGLVGQMSFTIRHNVLLILDNQLGKHFLAIWRDIILGKSSISSSWLDRGILLRPGRTCCTFSGSLSLYHSSCELLGCMSIGTYCGHQFKLLQSETILKSFLSQSYILSELRLHLVFSGGWHHS